MDGITRQNVLDLITRDWGNYISQFRRLSPAEQAAFLEKQGYHRLADLLAHIAAWWQEGLQSIEDYKKDPAAKQPEIDVDTFNAQAVESVRGLPEDEVVRSFEEMRCKFAEVVRRLSDEDFKDERVVNQIRMELVNHLEDHRIQ
jgi:hypothetical protein